MPMKVSVVTVCFNAEEFIESAIVSVLNQTYTDLEYIVVDGASRDGTMKVVNQYMDQISSIISEPDEGIYDAMNKGIAMATGDVIGILNADDFYKNESVISSVVSAFKSSGSDSVYGDLVYVDKHDLNKVKRYWKSGTFNKSKFYQGWMVPHPTFFVKKYLYDSHGGYNTELRSAADYEFMLRVLFKHRTTAHYVPKVLTVMRDGGVSNSSIVNRFRGNREDKQAWELNDLKPKPWTLFFKPLRKIKQFFVNGLHEV